MMIEYEFHDKICPYLLQLHYMKGTDPSNKSNCNSGLVLL